MRRSRGALHVLASRAMGCDTGAAAATKPNIFLRIPAVVVVVASISTVFCLTLTWPSAPRSLPPTGAAHVRAARASAWPNTCPRPIRNRNKKDRALAAALPLSTFSAGGTPKAATDSSRRRPEVALTRHVVTSSSLLHHVVVVMTALSPNGLVTTSSPRSSYCSCCSASCPRAVAATARLVLRLDPMFSFVTTRSLEKAVELYMEPPPRHVVALRFVLALS